MKRELFWLLAVVAAYAALLWYQSHRRRQEGSRRPGGSKGRGRVIPFPPHPRERSRVRRSG